MRAARARAAVLRAFCVEPSRSYRLRAKRELSLPSMSVLHTGSVTFVQRVDSALRLNVHGHVLAIDGVYLRQGKKSAPQSLTFMPLPEPTEQDVQRLCERTATRIERILRATCRYLQAEQADPHEDLTEDRLQLEQPALDPDAAGIAALDVFRAAARDGAVCACAAHGHDLHGYSLAPLLCPAPKGRGLNCEEDVFIGVRIRLVTAA